MFVIIANKETDDNDILVRLTNVLHCQVYECAKGCGERSKRRGRRGH
jgi:hypothetical protein